MEAVYTLRKDVISNEQNKDFISYGINVFNLNGELTEIVPGAFDDKQKASEFITLCNSEKVESVHLQNILDDFLY